jgi:hypothetical protein
MWNDPIIEDLHRIRETRATQFDNDLHRMTDALKTIEQQWLSKFPNLEYHRLPNSLSGEGDYIQTKGKLFAGETVDSLYDKIQAFREDKPC